jgi:hypothetical protein
VSRDQLGLALKKHWLLSTDEHHCPVCRINADAGAIDLEETFPDGSQATPAHPNCPCDIEAVL